MKYLALTLALLAAALPAFAAPPDIASDDNWITYDSPNTGLSSASSWYDSLPSEVPTITIGPNGDWTRVYTDVTPMEAGSGGGGGLTLSASGGALTCTYSSADSVTAYRVCVNSRTVNSGEMVTASYTQPGDGFQVASTGKDLASFSSLSVDNQSNQGTGAATACDGFAPIGPVIHNVIKSPIGTPFCVRN